MKWFESSCKLPTSSYISLLFTEASGKQPYSFRKAVKFSSCKVGTHRLDEPLRAFLEVSRFWLVQKAVFIKNRATHWLSSKHCLHQTEPVGCVKEKFDSVVATNYCACRVFWCLETYFTPKNLTHSRNCSWNELTSVDMIRVKTV